MFLNYLITKENGHPSAPIAGFKYFQECLEYVDYANKRGASVTVWEFKGMQWVVWDQYSAEPLSGGPIDLT